MIPCRYRRPSNEARIFLCLHPQVVAPGQKVWAAICKGCRQRTVDACPRDPLTLERVFVRPPQACPDCGGPITVETAVNAKCGCGMVKTWRCRACTRAAARQDLQSALAGEPVAGGP